MIAGSARQRSVAGASDEGAHDVGGVTVSTASAGDLIDIACLGFLVVAEAGFEPATFGS